ncbi:MAG TPA: 4'-phosphopantetheinyl transferase superfamily protein [Solirubrobacterales bacterium]|nr:4'-phosphopantetheinyl transferase superfamily protein [Solirubrobacterales bacterium]
MSMPAAGTHVWQAQLDSEGWPGAERLPAEERERAARLRSPLARRRWQAARWALRTVLGRYLEEDPAEVLLRLGKHGKPMLAAPSPVLRFNLSHSADLALVAIAWEREVGVDVERIAPRRELAALARRALGRAEADAIEGMPPEDRLDAFHAAWTRREAVAKCLGTGLWAPPDAEVETTVASLDAGPGFAAAIAVTGTDLPPLRRFVI